MTTVGNEARAHKETQENHVRIVIEEAKPRAASHTRGERAWAQAPPLSFR